MLLSDGSVGVDLLFTAVVRACLMGDILVRFIATALRSCSSAVAVGLDGEAATNPYDLGYSRRKLLALASILAMGTPVVVSDLGAGPEVVVGIDPGAAHPLPGLLEQWARRAACLVCVHGATYLAGQGARVIAADSRASRVTLVADNAEALLSRNVRSWISSRCTSLPVRTRPMTLVPSKPSLLEPSRANCSTRSPVASAATAASN